MRAATRNAQHVADYRLCLFVADGGEGYGRRRGRLLPTARVRAGRVGCAPLQAHSAFFAAPQSCSDPSRPRPLHARAPLIVDDDGAGAQASLVGARRWPVRI